MDGDGWNSNAALAGVNSGMFKVGVCRFGGRSLERWNSQIECHDSETGNAMGWHLLA